MRMTRKYRIAGSILRSTQIAFVSATLTLASLSQEQPRREKLAYGADKANLTDAIAKVGSGDFQMVHLEMLAKFGTTQSIPNLKKQFALAKDTTLKEKIAGVLVRLGDKEAIYWDFLTSQASLAADSPFPLARDGQGNVVPGQLSPEYLSWAKAHDETLDPVYELPARVMLLGETEDTRAVPILRRALASPNYFIQTVAAGGLAQMQDKESIPLIIEACQRASSEGAASIASNLVYFDDPKAQIAIDKYLPKETAKVFRDARSTGKRPFD